MWTVNVNLENKHGMQNWHDDYYEMPIGELAKTVAEDNGEFDWASAENDETGEFYFIYSDGSYEQAEQE